MYFSRVRNQMENILIHNNRMDLDLSNPVVAAGVAGAAVAVYVHVTSDSKRPLSAYMKPATLVAILVFFISSNGMAKSESISKEPF